MNHMIKTANFHRYLISMRICICKNGTLPVGNHFEDMLDMVSIKSGAERLIESVKLSRYSVES